jgi:hypothetical protein
MLKDLGSILSKYFTRIDLFRASINSSQNPNKTLEKIASSVMSLDEAKESAQEAGIPSQEFIQTFLIRAKEEFGQDDLTV